MAIYPATAYRQAASASAPVLVSFVATAEDLLTWAGIPRRTEQSMFGFQRIEDSGRVARAKEFFRLPPNQSPTALVVGVHQVAPGSGRLVRLLSVSASGVPGPELALATVQQPTPCFLSVEHDATVETLPVATARLIAALEARLGGEPDLASSDTGPDVEPTDYAVIDDDDEEQEGDEVELGRSLIRDLVTKLRDPKWAAENEGAVRDLAKPATVIDGQHRVLGAAACERDIPFTVCALFDCSWSEQVFQFTVVNYSAKGIPDQFITANAALSLTQGELGQLQTRLAQAQVKVVEYQLMNVVHFDKQSPFFDLVNLSETKNPDKIGYGTMIRLAKDLYSARHPVLKKVLLPNLFPDVKSARLRLERWKENEIWGAFFKDFWLAVQAAYAPISNADGNSLWAVGRSNLMVAVVLLEFQRTFLQDLNNQDEEYFDSKGIADPIEHLRSKVRARAGKFLGFFPSDFFAVTWKMSSLNNSSGRKALRTAMDQMLQNKGKFQYAKTALVTGETG